ncbi:MAG: hypothetical protein ACKO8G_05300 [Actinomycetota bacterium]
MRRSAAAATLAVLLAACGGGSEAPAPAGGLALDPVPYVLTLPADAGVRLSVVPADAAYAAEVEAAGGTAVAEIVFRTDAGESLHFGWVYRFPADAFDLLRRPESPPRYGEELRREDGGVLAWWGPLDMPFDPASADGRDWAALSESLRDPQRYAPAA